MKVGKVHSWCKSDNKAPKKLSNLQEVKIKGYEILFFDVSINLLRN